MNRLSLTLITVIAVPLALALSAMREDDKSLWNVYNDALKQAKYIDLTHAFEPMQPVWSGFSNARFRAARAGRMIEGYVKEGEEYAYEKHGFVATAYDLPTDQYGTQLDPPAHWEPLGATISDLPSTYAIRPLVVINIAGKVEKDPGYHLRVEDIRVWEEKHGRIPEGSVVMVRSDWYKRWDDVERFTQKPFPGVSLDALKFLHIEGLPVRSMYHPGRATTGYSHTLPRRPPFHNSTSECRARPILGNGATQIHIGCPVSFQGSEIVRSSLLAGIAH
jgi:kynurenine formamidase